MAPLIAVIVAEGTIGSAAIPGTTFADRPAGRGYGTTTTQMETPMTEEATPFTAMGLKEQEPETQVTAQAAYHNALARSLMAAVASFVFKVFSWTTALLAIVWLVLLTAEWVRIANTQQWDTLVSQPLRYLQSR